MTIRRLDPIVMDQIAAGEVVERPASVVKELVENAIDAGATRIEILLREGGCRRIEVRDNGSGIPADELPLAVASHATSKLRKPSDLEAIASLGFRGEALASIASVSRFEMTSCLQDSQEAYRLRVLFGRPEDVVEVAGAPGTRIVVDDLFAELPARQKFLKRASAEYARCSAWVERLALAHVGVGFRLEHDEKLRLEILPESPLRERCAKVFGQGLSERMIELERSDPMLQIQGLVGPPESARRDATRVHLFLNGRWVRDARLLRAVREGVREFVPLGHYPTLYLAMALPPDRVDVNVHPQKTEVRFRDERLVFGSVVNTLRRGLSQSSWATRRVGEIGSSSVQEGKTPSFGDSSPSRGFPAPNTFGGAPSVPVSQATPQFDLQVHPADVGKGKVLSIGKTFLVRQVDGGMEIIDQHALHERVNLEELRRDLQNTGVAVQPLLVPALVDLSRQELELLLSRSETFQRLGVEMEAFGETTLAIRAVPARLQRLVPEQLVQDLLEIALDHRKATPDQIQEEALFRMACCGAVMAGDDLGEEALRDLLARGADLPQDRTCAHGRPVRVFLSMEDLERAFYRR